MEKRGLIVECERPLPLVYDDTTVPCAYKIDLVVNDLVIVELKSVERILPVHIAQVRTYLKLSGLKVGLLINFNVSRMSDGIHRILHPDLSTQLAKITKEADETPRRF